jgi:hypothetical protein
LPLALEIGDRAAPQTYRFLVTMMCIRRDDGWRIAALLTTAEKK